jgi:hypothetical protein
MEISMRNRMTPLLSFFFALIVTGQAWALPFFGGASLNYTKEDEITRPGVWANWDYTLPGQRPVDGGSEAYKKAAKFPYVRGARLRVYFPANTGIGRNIKEAYWTGDQRLKLKQRDPMKYYPGKGWGFELIFGEDDCLVRGVGPYTFWAVLKINDARRTREGLGPIGGSRLADVKAEWPINFVVYDAPEGPLTRRRIADAQIAKGAGGVTLTAPREEEIIVPFPGEPTENTAPSTQQGATQMAPQQSTPQGKDWTVTIKLEGANFTSAWFRIEATDSNGERMVDWVHVANVQAQIDLPYEVDKFELWIVSGENDKGGTKIPCTYSARNRNPAVVTNNARR